MHAPVAVTFTAHALRSLDGGAESYARGLAVHEIVFARVGHEREITRFHAHAYRCHFTADRVICTRARAREPRDRAIKSSTGVCVHGPV